MYILHFTLLYNNDNEDFPRISPTYWFLQCKSAVLLL